MKQFPDKLFLRALPPDEIRQRGSDRALYEVMSPFSFESVTLGRVVVPVGFITDFASIPRAALWYVKDDDPCILMPSLPHDALYLWQGVMPDGRTYTREQADQVLREGMEICGARRAQASVVYWAVRLAGASHWKN